MRFYEEKDGQIVWEAFADFQPSQVHKQHAIWFRTPRYRTIDIQEPVKVFIQLRRPSDGATSDPLPFELLPLDSGRPLYWSYKRKKGNYNLFNAILANDLKQKISTQTINEENPTKTPSNNVVVTEKPIVLNTPIEIERNNNEPNVVNREITPNKEDYSEIRKKDEKSFNELLTQVAELDEIYSDTHARLLKTQTNEMDRNESFDDTRTYTSLQLAFKNPLEIKFDEIIVDEVPINADVNPLEPPPLPPPPAKRENPSTVNEKLPPLPPKRAKKIETFIGNSLNDVSSNNNTKLNSNPVSRTQSFNLHRPKIDEAPGKSLPPTPQNSQSYATLPNPKKPGFFSKLFSRSKSKTPQSSKRNSIVGSRSLHSANSNNLDLLLSRSVGNVSTQSTQSIRIPLKDDSPPPLATEDNKNNNVTNINNDYDMNLDLTEAENYALYTAMAPHATQSEFDEMSCYYAPVEGGKLLTSTEVYNKLHSNT